MAGGQDDGQRMHELPQATGQFHSVDIWQMYVDERDLRVELLDSQKSRAAIIGFAHHRVSLRFQQPADGFTETDVIINDEDTQPHGCIVDHRPRVINTVSRTSGVAQEGFG